MPSWVIPHKETSFSPLRKATSEKENIPSESDSPSETILSFTCKNILLAAHALGLGAVWLGTYPVDDRVTGVRNLLDIPDNIMPLSLISIGHPLEPKPSENRFNPEKLHFDKW